MAENVELNKDLSEYEIRDVEGLEDGEEKGRGSYGAVYKVEVYGVPCIAKCLHDILVGYQQQNRGKDESVDILRRKFTEECILHSKLRHPNIVQFLGVHYGLYSGELALILERLQWDLGEFVETHKQIPDSIKISFLLDVSHGLLYLHSRNPPIIHRDLSAGNVLLTGDGKAKIADLGASKILKASTSHWLVQVQTVQPGAFAYMPPEALEVAPVYDQAFDMFSFGAVALYTAIHEFPYVHEVPFSQLKEGKMHIAKRKASLTKAENNCLHPLILGCLGDDPRSRPSASQLCSSLKQLASQYPRKIGDFSELLCERTTVSFSSKRCCHKSLSIQVTLV